MKGIFTELLRLKGYLPQIKIYSDLHAQWLTLNQFGAQLQLGGGAFTNLKTLKRTIGVTASLCDYNFPTRADTVAENYDMSLGTPGFLVPIGARVLETTCKTVIVVNGITALNCVIGNVSAGNQFQGSTAVQVVNTIIGTFTTGVARNTATSKIWVGLTPTVANWSTVTTGKLEFNFTYLETY